MFEKRKPSAVFGNDAGEEEDPAFLRTVYIESPAYERALDPGERILCYRSRKGVGKSALLHRARLALSDKDQVCLQLTPSDLAGQAAGSFEGHVLQLREKLARLICAKLISDRKVVLTGDAEMALKEAEEDGFSSPGMLTRFARAFQKTVGAKLPSEAAPKGGAFRRLTRLADGNPVIVFVDDLDRGWKPVGVEYDRLLALITALREIARTAGDVRFRVAMREDVWQWLERKAEQIDKFRQYTELLTWSRGDLRRLLTQRIHAALPASDTQNQAHILGAAFEGSWKRKGEIKPIPEMLVTLARSRPRDLLQLAKGAAQRARNRGASRITADDVEAEWKETYSRTKFQDLTKEFQEECPQTETLMRAFLAADVDRPMEYDTVMQQIKSVNGRTSIAIFSRAASNDDCLALLYRTGFISARVERARGNYEHIHYDDAPELVETRVKLHDYEWEIHLAFRPYLKAQKAGDRRARKRRQRRR